MVTMSNACETLSPRPAAVTGPITTISADNYLGLESDGEEGSTRSSRDEFVDLESGNAQEPNTQRNEMRFVSEAASKNETFWSKITKHWRNRRTANEATDLPFTHRPEGGRPKLMQKTAFRKQAPANSRGEVGRIDHFLLVGPSAILFFVPGRSTLKICLIMIFTLFFALAMTICTKAKRHEMLAATATYAAVLVVFLGNVNPSGAAS